MSFDVNWRFIAGVAGFGLAISLITGVFAGVAIGALLVRALIAGVAFGVLGAVAFLIIERYVPELLQVAGGSEADEADDEAEGQGVDIELPEENPHIGRGPDESFEGADQEDFIEEVEELSAEPDDAEEVEEAEPVDSLADSDTPSTASTQNESEPSGIAETLPDLESLSSSFGSPSGTDQDEGEPPKSDKTVTVEGQQHDPEELAKAVKTFLKKNEEG
jgi:hypothetical protein